MEITINLSKKLRTIWKSQYAMKVGKKKRISKPQTGRYSDDNVMLQKPAESTVQRHV